MSMEARAALESLSGRRDAHVKRALALVLDAVGAMERELEVLQRRTILQSRGVSLLPHPVRIGADGLVAEKPLGLEGPVLVHLGLMVRGHIELLSLPGELAPDQRHVRFGSLLNTDRDVLVAFTFDQQRKERRRELDAVAGY
jgi:hypothetical protein